MQILSTEAHNALNLISFKINNEKLWNYFLPSIGRHCFICNKTMYDNTCEDYMRDEIIYNHGLDHLKEYNLLVFI